MLVAETAGSVAARTATLLLATLLPAALLLTTLLLATLLLATLLLATLLLTTLLLATLLLATLLLATLLLPGLLLATLLLTTLLLATLLLAALLLAALLLATLLLATLLLATIPAVVAVLIAIFTVGVTGLVAAVPPATVIKSCLDSPLYGHTSARAFTCAAEGWIVPGATQDQSKFGDAGAGARLRWGGDRSLPPRSGDAGPLCCEARLFRLRG